MQATLPPDVKLDLVADQPRVVSERIRDFFREFGIAIVAVILVTMLLLPLRVALVSAIAIPVIGVDDLRHVERLRHRVATGVDPGADCGAGHGGG